MPPSAQWFAYEAHPHIRCKDSKQRVEAVVSCGKEVVGSIHIPTDVSTFFPVMIHGLRSRSVLSGASCLSLTPLLQRRKARVFVRHLIRSCWSESRFIISTRADSFIPAHIKKGF